MHAHDELVAAITRADQRLDAHVRRTPVESSTWLSTASGAEVHLKLENHQLTGSFKLRGALNRVLVSEPQDRDRGFVAASTGNHGLAMAHATSVVDSPLTVFVPSTAAPAKVALLAERGIEVTVSGEDCTEAEAAARGYAAEHNKLYVSPYNDPEVIAGQGTIGAELVRQLAGVDVLFVALGGGGLISGVAAAVKARWPEIEVVGCSPSNSAVMAHSLDAGRLLDEPSAPTLSDGTAGGVEADSITFALCQQLVDRCVLVDEAAIEAALRDFTTRHHSLIEGAAAVPLAALLASGRHYAGRTAAAVLCGANIAPQRLANILAPTG